MPWTKRTRQEEGTLSEKQMAKKRGARVHPNSGAGRIKHDASDDDTLYEMKLANKIHTIHGAELERILQEGTRRGKDAKYVVRFSGYNLVLEGTITYDHTE